MSHRTVRPRGKRFALTLVALLALGASVQLLYELRNEFFGESAQDPTVTFRNDSRAGAAAPASVIDARMAERSTFPSLEAQACGNCHQRAFDSWAGSQHAHANRLVDETDRPAFSRTTTVISGRVATTPVIADDRFQFEVEEPDGTVSHHRVEAVIGSSPLIQYLVTGPDGGLQAISTAWDTNAQEWFDVTADPREPNDWGYWANRGLTWNSRCAFCHMTKVAKGYDSSTDRYATSWAAMGVSCSQCHKGSDEHAQQPELRELFPELTPEQTIDNCASCHARRDELTLSFEPGEHFSDHYRLVLADDALAFHADGQVADEDFEYGSFRLSRMGYRGITCLDCHDPHSGKLLAPVDNNTLCLTCHREPGLRGAITIDPTMHSHHPVDSAGSLCVECHMPRNLYMMRDQRRDHGFTIPDPQLTLELGIPNACNRCHQEQGPTWATQHTQAWYGERMERRSRERARIIARAQQLDPEIVPQLIEVAKDEAVPAWRASLARLLAPWADSPEVQEVLLHFLGDQDALVRAAAAFALGGTLEGTAAVLDRRDDPRRVVRVDAIWATLGHAPLEPRHREELQRTLIVDADQPSGAFRAAQWALVEGRGEDAVTNMRKVIRWDRSSAEAHYMLGTVLHQTGRSAEAAEAFEEAIRLLPDNGQYLFALALLYGELGRAGDAVSALEQVVRLEPSFARASYNLGLGYAQLNRLEDAADALSAAAALMPDSPQAEYALATVRLRQGQRESARDAAARALAIDPDYVPARSLLETTQ